MNEPLREEEEVTDDRCHDRFDVAIGLRRLNLQET